MSRRLKSLESELGITIHRLDTYTLTFLGTIFPRLFGLTNTTDAALADIQAGLISPAEGETYLYWDIIHPTSVVHETIAQLRVQKSRISMSVAYYFTASAAIVPISPANVLTLPLPSG